MTDATVRLARVTDADAIGRINVDSWRLRFNETLPDDVLASLNAEDLAFTWTRSILNPPTRQYRVLVAIDDDAREPHIAGYAAIGPCTDPDADPSEVELIALEVDPLLHRRGHGSRLMAAAMDTARESGARSAVTWAPLQDAARRSFLQSAGWVPDSAFRDIALDADGTTLREARLVTGLQES